MAILDSYDLRTVSTNVIREDLQNAINDISEIPLPFTDRVGSTSHSNTFFEWQADRLGAINAANAVIDGSDGRTPAVQAQQRLGNYGQISTKTVRTSTRADKSNTAGYAEALAYQVIMRTRELKQDVEAMALLNNANVQDTGDTGVAGETAGLEAWVDELDVQGGTKSPVVHRDLSTGSITIGGWGAKTGVIIPAVDYSTVSAVNALTFDSIKDVIDGLYQLNANPTVLMCRPAVCRLISEFMYSSSAQISTLVRDKNEMGAAQAQMSVGTMLTDYGFTVDIVPNRLMQQSGDGTPDSDTVFVFDPNMIKLSYMSGYQVKKLSTTGLNETREISVDWGLQVSNPDGLGAIFGVDDAAAMTA